MTDDVAVPTGCDQDVTTDQGAQQKLPLTDIQIQALKGDNGSWLSLLWVLPLFFVFALFLSLPLLFRHGNTFGAAPIIAAGTVALYLLGWSYNRHQDRRDIRAKVFVRYSGPMDFDGPAQNLVLGVGKKLHVLEGEKEALSKVLPCRGQADYASHSEVIFEVRDESDQVIYMGSAMRDVIERPNQAP